MGLSRVLPFVGVTLLSAWAVWSTQPPSLADSSSARLEPTPRARPGAPAPARTVAALTDLTSGTRVEVDAARDNRGDAWFARGGTAVWTHTQQGLALLAIDGRVLQRIPGAIDIRETDDGAVRAYRINDDWLVTTPRGIRRLLGPLAFPSLSPDGRYFAFELLGGRPREVHALELRTGEEIDVASALGRCHCTTRDAYGFPEWRSATVLTFRDAGDFAAPPEEHEAGARFEYDLATRTLTRVAEPDARPATTPCDRLVTLPAPADSATLEYRRACLLPPQW